MPRSHRAPLIRISANAPVFDLPILVALEQGGFRQAGLNVAYSPNPDTTAADPLARPKERAFEARAADGYNQCAWGGMDRLGRSARPARITALRPAVAAQAIVTFDDTLQNLHDLAEVPVGVNHYTASHYATLQMLSGGMERDKVRVVHAGGPDDRYRRLRSGRLRAVSLMEPHLSLALQDGAHLVALTFYRGADVMATELPDDVVDVWYDVINAAVDDINRDFSRWRPLVVAPLAGRLAPEALGRQFLRYSHAETFDETAAQPLLPWMDSWGLPHASPASH